MIRSAFLGMVFLTAAALVGAITAAEPEAPSLVGTWKVIEYKDDGGDQRGRIGMTKIAMDAGKFAKLVFTKDECWVVRADGKRDAVKGLTNCGFKKYTVKPGKELHEIELIGFAGVDGGDAELTYVGIVKVQAGKLHLCWNEEGADRPTGKKLPTKFASDGMMNLFVAERISDKPEEKPKELFAFPKK